MGHLNHLGICLFSIATFLVINLNTLGSEGYRVPYTQRESKALQEFRPLVEKYLTMDYQRSDGYLLRFIRGRNFDLNGAAADLEQTFTWRQKYQIDSILDKEGGNYKIFSDLPYSVDGFDKYGRPLVLCPGGRWDLRRYILAGKQEILQQHFRRMFEEVIRKVFRAAERTERDIDQFHMIVDVQGFNRRQHLCLACLAAITIFAQDIHTGSAYFIRNITVVNVPRIFGPVISIGNAVVKRVTIQSFDSNKAVWKAALLEEISLDQLPVSLGGTRRGE